MSIETHYWKRPIPTRDCDWTATTDDYEPGDPIGYGATEVESIADLARQIARIDNYWLTINTEYEDY